MLALKSVLFIFLLVSSSCAQDDSQADQVAAARDNDQLAAAQREIAKLTAERDAALNKLNAAEVDNAAALRDLDKSKVAIQDLTRKIQELSIDLKKEALKTAELQTQLSQATQAQTAVLNDYQAAKQSEQALQTELHKNTARLQELEQKLAQAEREAAKSLHESAAASAAQVQALESDLKKAQAAAQRQENLTNALQQKAKELEAVIAGHKVSAGQQQQENAVLDAKVKALERSLANAQADVAKALKAAASGDELQALLRQAQESWLPLWLQYRVLQTQEYVIQLLEDLKGGKHGSVGVHVHSFLDVANQHATNAFVYVKPHVDKGYAAASHHAGKAYAVAKPHLDEGLAKLSVALDKARVVVDAHWKKHVTDAEWLHEVKATYNRVEQELIREVSKAMRDIPALKPYSDPVTVQLMVYAIILIPALVIFVPALALLCTRPSANKDSPKRGKTEKPKPHGHGKRPHKRA